MEVERDEGRTVKGWKENEKGKGMEGWESEEEDCDRYGRIKKLENEKE